MAQNILQNLYDQVRHGGMASVYKVYRESPLRFSWKKWLPVPGKVLVDRPVFFLGVQGGGMTLILRMLARHQHVMTASGDSSQWFGRDEFALQYAKLLPKSVTSFFYFLKPYHQDCPNILNSRRPVLSRRELDVLPAEIQYLRMRYGSFPWWNYASDELLPYFRATEQAYSFEEAEVFKAFIKKMIFIGMPLGKEQTYRFVDKSQVFSLKVALLERIFDRERPFFIAVVRNPYAICFRAASRGYLSNLDIAFDERLKICAQHWKNTFQCIEEDFSKITPSRTMLFRIEDFLRNPSEILKLVCKKVDLEFNTDMLPHPGHKIPWWASDQKKWYPIEKEVNQKYLKQLDERAVDIIRSECGELAEEFNYSPKGGVS